MHRMWCISSVCKLALVSLGEIRGMLDATAVFGCALHPIDLRAKLLASLQLCIAGRISDCIVTS